MAELRDIVVDCRHPASVARFWADVLDGYRIAPYDEAEIERLRAAGVDGPDHDPSVCVLGPPGAPRWWFVLVPEGKITKNRVHLDITGSVADLLALGATVLAVRPALTVMADPEGNEFCVFPVT